MSFGISLRTRGKAILLVITLLASFAVAVVGVAHIWLAKEVDAEMTANTQGALRVLAVTFGDAHKTASIDIDHDLVTRAVIDAMPSFADHDIVDRTAKMISGVATIFVTRGSGDHVRASTTVKTETGARAIGTALAADHPARSRLDRGEAYYGAATLFGQPFITGYHPIKNTAGRTIGAFFVGLPMARADAMVASLTNSIMIVAAIVLLVLASAAFLIVTRFVRPLSGLAAGMNKLADGDFAVVLPGLGRTDEVGEMAQAVETFKVKLADKARREAEERQAEEAREADARRAAEQREAAQHRAAEEKAATDRKAAMHRLADEFEHAVGNIVGTVSSASNQLETAATTLTRSAETTQHLSGVVASASEQASANVQAVASATEELTSSVHEISRQVHESSKIAGEAVKQAEKTDARIAALSQAASRIGDVVKLITAVAEQTNLLALNATIEAARAGEAGRGFAVVAAEVKALAGQTAKATGEISTQVANMQTATNDSVASIKEIGGTIVRISEIAATIAAAVEQQGAATQEISRNVQEAAKGTVEVATNIVSVNRGAGETGSASSQVLSSAQSLSSESGHLRQAVERFLVTVRAG